MGTLNALSAPSLDLNRRRVIGIGEMAVSIDRSEVLATYSLGSCVGLSLFDEESGVGGMIHCMLPLSNADPEKAQRQPCLYTDTGILALLQAVLDAGAQKRRLLAKVAGAASPLGENLVFRIGQRNYTVLRKMLWKNNILIRGEAVGGTVARTMYLRMQDGATVIRSTGKEELL